MKEVQWTDIPEIGTQHLKTNQAVSKCRLQMPEGHLPSRKMIKVNIYRTRPNHHCDNF